MTAPANCPATAALPDVMLDTLLRSTLDALPHAPDAPPEQIAGQREAARIAVLSLTPRTQMEADLAGRIVVAQHACMDCFRRAALPDLPDDKVSRMLRDAMALSRMQTGLLRDLQQLQAMPASALLPNQGSAAAGPAEPARPAQPAPAPAPRPPVPAGAPPRPAYAAVLAAPPAASLAAKLLRDVATASLTAGMPAGQAPKVRAA